MFLSMYTLRVHFFKVGWYVIKGIAVYMMNNLAPLYQIVGMSAIPNQVRAMDITPGIDGRVSRSLNWGNPDKIILFALSFTSAPFPSPLKIRVAWAVKSTRSTMRQAYCRCDFGSPGWTIRTPFTFPQALYAIYREVIRRAIAASATTIRPLFRMGKSADRTTFHTQIMGCGAIQVNLVGAGGWS